MPERTGGGPGDTKCGTIPWWNLAQSCWLQFSEPRIGRQTGLHPGWSHPSLSLTRVPAGCGYWCAYLAQHESRLQSHVTNLGLHQMEAECDGSPSTTRRTSAGPFRTFWRDLPQQHIRRLVQSSRLICIVCVQWWKYTQLSDVWRDIIFLYMTVLLMVMVITMFNQIIHFKMNICSH